MRPMISFAIGYTLTQGGLHSQTPLGTTLLFTGSGQSECFLMCIATLT